MQQKVRKFVPFPKDIYASIAVQFILKKSLNMMISEM
jgi:hypothetical protein